MATDQLVIKDYIARLIKALEEVSQEPVEKTVQILRKARKIRK